MATFEQSQTNDRRTMNQIELLTEAAKNFRTVGTVTFSSRFLVNKMVSPIQKNNAQCIVELGAGNGCITKGILGKMGDDSKLYSFEINDKFCDMVRALNDDRLEVINDSAEKIEEYLQQHNEHKADYIISAVPLVVLPDDIGARILAAVKKTLKPGGVFVQLSYNPVMHKKHLTDFDLIKRKFTPLNLPPAFVFVCQN